MSPDNSTFIGHGRETYAVFYDDEVQKRPLPTFGDAKRKQWLKKQHRTKAVIDDIRAVGNPIYNIPQMKFINDDEFNIREERAKGQPLTPQLYASLTARQRLEIINSLASFLVDMNELKPIGPIVRHKICEDIKFNRLNSFIDNRMSTWFRPSEIIALDDVRNAIGKFEYNTRLAWSHGDLSVGNVLYDPDASKLSLIDFAEADYHFIYHDIFASTQLDMDIYQQLYKTYNLFHNHELYEMPDIKDPALREIMLNRGTAIYLKRIIKASDDLRKNPRDDKSARNNIEKVAYIRQQMQNIYDLQKQISL